MFKHSCVIVLALMICAGCTSTYVTPGRGARMEAVGAPAAPTAAEIGPGTDGSIRQALEKKPLVHFPTAVAVVRVQAPNYSSATIQGWGKGQYSIVTQHDIEKQEDFDRLGHLPQLNGIAMVNRMLIQGELTSDLALRRAAAELHADMLLVYTLDTTFRTRDESTPLSVITLGLAPDQKLRVMTTASAVLLDTRNGYVYGLAEAEAKQEAYTSVWRDRNAADDARKLTESQAFEKLVGELEKTWTGVVATYAAPTAQPAARVE